MTGFEPESSSIESDHAINCATTTSQLMTVLWINWCSTIVAKVKKINQEVLSHAKMCLKVVVGLCLKGPFFEVYDFFIVCLILRSEPGSIM